MCRKVILSAYALSPLEQDRRNPRSLQKSLQRGGHRGRWNEGGGGWGEGGGEWSGGGVGGVGVEEGKGT